MGSKLQLQTLWYKCNASIVDQDVQGKVLLLEGSNKLLCGLEGGEVQRHALHCDSHIWELFSHLSSEPIKSLWHIKQETTTIPLNPQYSIYT